MAMTFICVCTEAGEGMSRFVLPLVMGSVQQVALQLAAEKGAVTGHITLVARRSVQRPGVRHWRRGADAQARPPWISAPQHIEGSIFRLPTSCSVADDGHTIWSFAVLAQGVVANFVETEQLVELEGPGLRVVSAFVQLRGSIPLLWSQIPNIKYKPSTRLAPESAYGPVFTRHITNLVESYKARPCTA